jgi:two-component system response regulator VicR
MHKKILVIDDDQDILDLTEIILQEKGYEVIASLTADILEDVLLIHPDLILIDDWLNGTSGHELCKKMKSAEATRHIKIIIFSASTGLQKIAEDCLADNFIEKPFEIDHLTDTIAILLSGGSKANLATI